MKPYDIPWPTAGLNLNTPPTELASNEAYELQNFVPTEAGMRLRGPVNQHDYYADLMTVSNGDAVIGVREINGVLTAGLVPSADRNSGSAPYYFGIGSPSAPGTPRALVMASTTWALVTTGGLTVTQSIGRQCKFDTSCYAVSFEGFSDGKNRYGDTGQVGSQIIQWAGANRADHTTTAGADTTVGSRTVTLAATHATSLAGMIMTAGTGNPHDNQRWNYVVSGHTPGSATVTLEQPWGYGDASVTTLTSGTSLTFTSQARVYQAPVAAGAVETHLGRLWAGRGYVQYSSTQSVYHSGAVFWSYPGNPSHWPTNNYIILDTDRNDPIMAMISVDEGLLVMSLNRTFLITGYDEASFQVQTVSTEFGCLHSQAATTFDGGAAWVSREGVKVWRRGAITDITEPKRGVGVSFMTQRELKNTLLDGIESYHQLPSLAYFNDRLYYHNGYFGANTTNPIWVFDLSTGAWSTLTFGGDGITGISQRVIHLLQNIGSKKLLAFCQDGSYDLSEVHETSRDYGSALGYAGREWLYNDSGVDVSARIEGVCSQVVKPAADDTVRLRDVDVFHNLHYDTVGSGNVAGFAVGVQPNFGTGVLTSIGTIEARPVPNLQRADYTRPYVDRFTTTAVPDEASLYRVRITTTLTSAVLFSSVITKMRMYIDPQTVRPGRIDPTATAQ